MRRCLAVARIAHVMRGELEKEVLVTREGEQALRRGVRRSLIEHRPRHVVEDDARLRKALEQRLQLRKRRRAYLDAHRQTGIDSALPGRKRARIVESRVLRRRMPGNENAKAAKSSAHPTMDSFGRVRREHVDGEHAGETAWMRSHRVGQ